MNIIKQLEKEVEYCKANMAVCKKRKYSEGVRDLHNKISGLELALARLNQPSNTQINVDTKPCAYCANEKQEYLRNYCSVCGEALS